jgi:hypothetical protein
MLLASSTTRGVPRVSVLLAAPVAMAAIPESVVAPAKIGSRR